MLKSALPYVEQEGVRASTLHMKCPVLRLQFALLRTRRGVPAFPVSCAWFHVFLRVDNGLRCFSCSDDEGTMTEYSEDEVSAISGEVPLLCTRYTRLLGHSLWKDSLFHYEGSPASAVESVIGVAVWGGSTQS